MDVTVASRAGRNRPASEDRWVAVTGGTGVLLAVADGMGGTVRGGDAAAAALAGLQAGLDRRPAHTSGDPTTPAGTPADPGRLPADPQADPADPGRLPADPADPGWTRAVAGGPGLATVGLDELAAAVAVAHDRVRALATESIPVALRPGTTLTAAVVAGGVLRLAHLGDSSCWLLRRGRLRRLTEQHTHAAALVRAGAVQPGSPAQRRLDGLLTRYAGMPGTACPQLATVRLRPGDRLLVASDGVTRALTVPALATLLAGPGVTAADLVRAAEDAGGRDDATALLCGMDTVPETVNTQYVGEGATR